MPETPPKPADDDALAAALAAALDAADPEELEDLTISEGLPLADVARQCGISVGTVSNIVCMFKARLAARILMDPTAPRLITSRALKVISKL